MRSKRTKQYNIGENVTSAKNPMYLGNNSLFTNAKDNGGSCDSSDED